jgi:glutamine cyclotransferase
MPADDEFPCWDAGDVLHGIASPPNAHPTTIFVTGKNWKHIYEISVTPQNQISHIPLI